jgi:hypothetical protein
MTEEQVMESAKGWGPNAQAGLKEMYLDQRKANVTGYKPSVTGTYGDFQGYNDSWRNGRARFHDTRKPGFAREPDYKKRLETVNHEANHFGNWMGRNAGGFNEAGYEDNTEFSTRIRANSVDPSNIPSRSVDGVTRGMQNMIGQGGSPFSNWRAMRNDPTLQGTSNVPESDRLKYEMALYYENATALFNFNNNPDYKGKSYQDFKPRNFGFDNPFQFNVGTPPSRQVINMSGNIGPPAKTGFNMTKLDSILERNK